MEDGSENISGANMEKGQVHGAEWQAEVRGHVANSASRNFDQAERTGDCFVVHSFAPLGHPFGCQW
jgi:hypothetical protein